MPRRLSHTFPPVAASHASQDRRVRRIALRPHRAVEEVVAMDAEERFAVLDAVIAAWKRGDLDAVLEHVTEDIEFLFALGRPPIVGKDAMRRVLEGLGGHQQEIRWRIVNRAQAGDVVFAEGIDDYVNPEGVRVRNPYVTVYEFEGARIRRWRDYYDGKVLERAEAGKAVPAWFAPLVSDERAIS